MHGSVIISSAEINLNNQYNSYEISALYNEFKKHFEQVICLNPLKLSYQFINGNFQIVHGFSKLDNISALIVRSTTGCEEASRVLTHVLYQSDCELLDPIERFNGAPAGKAIITIKDSKNKSVPDTNLFFNLQDCLDFIHQSDLNGWDTLVGKPSEGRKGENVELLDSSEKAALYAKSYFGNQQNKNNCLLLQKYISIDKEYRVIVLDGSVLGLVEKEPAPDFIARNAAKGSHFIQAESTEVADFALNKCSKKGLVGVDVILDTSGKFWLVESNRSPQWQYFEKATGINVASEIAMVILKRLKVSSELF